MRILFIFCFVFLISGCFALPIKVDPQISPRVKGKVIDSISQKPVRGAKVTLSSFDRKIESTRSLETTSNVDGDFEVGPVKAASEWWYIILLPVDGVCSYSLKVEHPDYQLFEDSLWQTTTGASVSSCPGFLSQTHGVELVPNSSN